MMDGLHPFLYGFLTSAALTVALIFLRFWRMTQDRLFIFFAAAFVALALNWLALAMTDSASDDRYHVFVLRLVAFVFILVGIVDKNRRAKRELTGARVLSR